MTREFILTTAVAIVAALGAIVATRLLTNFVRKSARTFEIRDASGVKTKFTLAEDQKFEDAIQAELSRLPVKSAPERRTAAL
jgi:hypothetical protein